MLQVAIEITCHDHSITAWVGRSYILLRYLVLMVHFSLSGDSLAYGIESFSGCTITLLPPFKDLFPHSTQLFAISQLSPRCGIARPLVLRRSSICIARKLSIWFVLPGSYQKLDLRRNDTRWATVLWSGKPGDVTSSNRDHMPWSLYYCLGRPLLYTFEVPCV